LITGALGAVNAPTDWSLDGRYIVYVGPGESDSLGGSLWILPLSDVRKPTRFGVPLSQAQGKVSPDGKWFAYSTQESVSSEIYVSPFPNPTAKWRVSIAGGSQPRWRRDGKELYYMAPDKTLMAVDVARPDRPGVPLPLFKTQAVDYLGGRYSYAPSVDGQRFLINTQQVDITPQSIDIVMGWQRPKA
jgi:Tol biopolymer transport system component